MSIAFAEGNRGRLENASALVIAIDIVYRCEYCHRFILHMF